MIVLDTSVLIGALTSPASQLPALTRAIEAGHRVLMPAVVVFEWLHGPRLAPEVAFQEHLLPAETALPFAADEAAVAAELYRSVARPRGREIDLLVAAHALVLGAPVWTLNVRDFVDLPGIELYTPE